MSEEELEAIKEAKKQIEEEAHNLNDINIFMTDSTTLKVLLNLIDKLQKELDNSISKDKICEMIDKRIDHCCTYDEMHTTALEDFKEIIEKGDIE